ncbi:unnamed protein product [Rhodiola kirilowii]
MAARAAFAKTHRTVRSPAGAFHLNSISQATSLPNPNPLLNSSSISPTAPPSLLRFVQIRFWRNNKSNYIPKSLSSGNFNDPKEPRAGHEESSEHLARDVGGVSSTYIGDRISNRDKEKFLIDMLVELKDSKEAVYGSLDSWVAWEQNFPIAMLKRALAVLEKKYEWHRIIQVIKWMLSKGQGTTMGTYAQLIKALDMDHRPEEAHRFWMRKIGSDLHSVPWDLCKRMISIYYRNNMLENLVKLFKGLESFDRKPPEKSIVQKVANAYELLGHIDEKNRILEKYKDLLSETRTSFKKPRKDRPKKKAKEGLDESASDMDDRPTAVEGIQT